MSSSEPLDAGALNMEFRPAKSLYRLHAAFMGLKDQKEETCGPYSLLKILKSLEDAPDRRITEDELARMAGTVISEEERDVSLKFRGQDEKGMDEGTRRKFYSVPLSVSGKPEELGTSAEGLAASIALTAGRRYAVLPIPSRSGRRIQLQRRNFGRFTEMLWRLLPAADIHMILNLQMNLLCSNDELRTIVDVLSFLGSGKSARRDNWRVGHFLVCCGLVRNRNVSRDGYFYLLQDTCKSRGMGGYLIQPGERVRSALVRDDGRGGGILLIVPLGIRDVVTGEIERFLGTGLWDNGTPYIPPVL